MSKTSSIKIWLQAARLRTLPLSMASIAMGNFLAVSKGSFRFDIFGLSVLTTLFLQILSNFANDYGDTLHGADSQMRIGPSRSVQAGLISQGSMKKAIILFAILALLSGLALVALALEDSLREAAGFFGLGLLSIAAAVYYTNGKVPYGYMGLGDLSVFLFFGLLGVVGSYYLQTRSAELSIFLPALCNGFLAVGVLNINNIRDIESDKAAGKFSIPVRIGRKWAIFYQGTLLLGTVVCALVFALVEAKFTAVWVFVLVVPFFVVNIQKLSSEREIDPLLKQLALSSLLFTLLFGVGLLVKI
jgi:1,4-dihydroxy-2-naphthoate octaprenyltransferase